MTNPSRWALIAIALLAAAGGASAASPPPPCLNPPPTLTNPITAINGVGGSPVFPSTTTSVTITLKSALNKTYVALGNPVVASGTTTSTSISFGGLAPGSYLVTSLPEVSGCWSPEDSTANFTISQPVASLSAVTLTSPMLTNSSGTLSWSGANLAKVSYTCYSSVTGSGSPSSGATSGSATVTTTGTAGTGYCTVTPYNSSGTAGTAKNSNTASVNLPAASLSSVTLTSTMTTNSSGTLAWSGANLATVAYTCYSSVSGSGSPASGATGGSVTVTTTGTQGTGYCSVTPYNSGGTAGTTVNSNTATVIPPTVPPASLSSVTLTSPMTTNSGGTLAWSGANLSTVTYACYSSVSGSGSPATGATSGSVDVTATGTAGTGYCSVTPYNSSGVAGTAVSSNTATVSSPATQTVTRTMEFEYDPNTGKMTKKMVEPQDSNLCLVQTYTYDTFGNLHTTTTRNCDSTQDPAEASKPTGLAVIATRTSTVTYDTTGTFPTSASNALNQPTSASFDDRFGTVLTQNDLNNLPITQTPDAFGRVTLVTAPDQTKTAVQYLYCTSVPNGYGTLTTCPANAATAKQVTPLASDGVTQIAPWKMTFYDVLARAIETQTQGFDGTIVVQDTIYDSLGRVHQVSRPYFAGSTPVYTTKSYDALGRVLTSVDPNNDPPKTYNYNGLVTSVTDANGHTTTKTRNGQHLVVGVLDAMNQVMSYEYDPFGDLTQTIDAGGITKTYLYDTRGRKTQTTDPDMGTWTYVYDSLGEIVQQTDAKAQVSSMTYDVVGRPTSRTEGGLTSNWEYDLSRSECTTGAGAAVGQLDRAWTTVGPAYSRIECYDGLERPVQERTLIGANTYIAGTSYNTYGRLSSRTYPAGFAYPAGFTVSYSYNTHGYLTELLNASNSSVIWQANTVDATGHVLSDSMAGGAFTATRTYDVLDRLKTVQVGSGNTIQNDEYWYDAVGNLQERSWIDSSDVSHTENFGYDPLNRLTSVAGPANKTYQYDDAGNLSYKSDAGTYTYTPGTHQISGISGTVNGSFGYDGNGNLTSEAGLTSTWMSFNMPSTLTRGTSSSSFSYGPEHQRTQQSSTTNGSTVTTTYVGSSFEQVVTSSTGITENHYYISAYGRRIAMLVDYSNVTTAWRYFHQDLLSSIEVVTDQAGTLVERLSYDAWGRRRNLDGTDAASPIVAIDKRGFTDQEEFDSLGVIDMNARIYDPLIARFVSPDPTTPRLYNMQSHNRYSYARNRPLRYIDPSGLDDIPMTTDGGGSSSDSSGGDGADGASSGSGTGDLYNCTGNVCQDKSSGCIGCAWTIVFGAIPVSNDPSTDPNASGTPFSQTTGNAAGNQPNQAGSDVTGTGGTGNGNQSCSAVTGCAVNGGSDLGNWLRSVPLIGGLLGGLGDIVSGVANVLTGSFGTGASEIAGGVASYIQIGAAEVTNVLLGAIGKVWVTAVDVANVLTLGQLSFPDNTPPGVPGPRLDNPTGFLGAVARMLFDLPFPDLGLYSGANWGATQWGASASYINWGDFVAKNHDLGNVDNMGWISMQLSGPGASGGQIPNGPVSIGNALLGIPFFWLDAQLGSGRLW